MKGSISGNSGNSSSSSSSLDGGGDYCGVIAQAAEATTTISRNYGKRAVLEVADGDFESTSDRPNKKKSRARFDGDAATSAAFSSTGRLEVSPGGMARGVSGRRVVVAAVAAVESEDDSGGGGDNEDGDDFTEIWV
eukprot:CAMPEP_0171771416 /NCGR_PEP_ID=MMETSP0991-20121206/54055_1 /TAXON_ID=483369 /ORGANISM="non described non described, Strain CCMP2098" /LENGTH=135 /DNA_ID=CAMNT_0012376699 /DNA_START=81 /DNA_END=488 /DNA_ORIENTATION=+